MFQVIALVVAVLGLMAAAVALTVLELRSIEEWEKKQSQNLPQWQQDSRQAQERSLNRLLERMAKEEQEK